MPHNEVVIGYSVNQARRRTVSILDFAWQVAVHVAHARSIGEEALVGSLSDYLAIGPDAMLARYLGIMPTSDLCAVIDPSGKIVDILAADPTIDKHPKGRLFVDSRRAAMVGKNAVECGLFGEPFPGKAEIEKAKKKAAAGG